MRLGTIFNRPPTVSLLPRWLRQKLISHVSNPVFLSRGQHLSPLALFSSLFPGAGIHNNNARFSSVF